MSGKKQTITSGKVREGMFVRCPTIISFFPHSIFLTLYIMFVRFMKQVYVM